MTATANGFAAPPPYNPYIGTVYFVKTNTGMVLNVYASQESAERAIKGVPATYVEAWGVRS